MTSPTQQINVPLITTEATDSRSNQATLRMAWDDKMKDCTPYVRHKKTHVLLVSWEKEYDDLKTEKEVDELAELFETDYGFDVQKKTVDVNKVPQHQMNKLIADFVFENDDKDSLLIVYYAGHAYADEKGALKLLGNVSQKELSHAKSKRNEIIWISAENNIKATAADVLVIFDCCHAGSLYDGRSAQRCFEFLGACSATQTTSPPGPQSFTKALIWALRQLAIKSRFASHELQYMIGRAPGFPEDQTPKLFHRYMQGSDHIMIAPKIMSSSTAEDQLGEYRDEHNIDRREYIDVRLWYNSPVDKDKIEEAANVFIEALRRDRHRPKRVDLLKIGTLRQIIAGAVEAWRDHSRHYRPNKQLRLIDTNTMLQASPVQVGRLVIPPLSTPATTSASSSVFADEDTPLLEAEVFQARAITLHRGAGYHFGQMVKCIWQGIMGFSRSSKDEVRTSGLNCSC